MGLEALTGVCNKQVATGAGPGAAGDPLCRLEGRSERDRERVRLFLLFFFLWDLDLWPEELDGLSPEPEEEGRRDTGLSEALGTVSLKPENP